MVHFVIRVCFTAMIGSCIAGSWISSSSKPISATQEIVVETAAPKIKSEESKTDLEYLLKPRLGDEPLGKSWED